MNHTWLSPMRAVLRRELHSAFLNRYVQLFAVLAIAGGVIVSQLGETSEAGPLFVAQLSLYVVSLFAVLVGVSSARAESEEWPIFFSQPVPRWISATGKLVALTTIFAVALLLLFAPGWLGSYAQTEVAIIYLHTVGLAAVCGSLGVFIGYAARDRVQGLLLAASSWLVLLFAFDLLALLAAHWEPLQKHPDLWVAGLMANPLDAFRIHTLFGMGQVPAEAAAKTPLAAWWLVHPGLWLAIISAAWVLLLLGLANRRVQRMEY
jgi:hypothetical protein